MAGFNEGTPASISDHVQAAAGPARGTTGKPTKTAQEQYQIASDLLAAEIPKLRKLLETDIKAHREAARRGGRSADPGAAAGMERREVI